MDKPPVFLAAYAEAAATAADPDDLIETIAGIRVGSYVPTRTVELVVHGLDIAALPPGFSTV